MKAPLELHADFEANAYEITYRRLPEGAFIVRDERIAPDVSAGIGRDGEVFGIELLSLEPAALTAAREFANAHRLAFPQYLPGVLVAS